MAPLSIYITELQRKWVPQSLPRACRRVRAGVPGDATVFAFLSVIPLSEAEGESAFACWAHLIESVVISQPIYPHLLSG